MKYYIRSPESFISMPWKNGQGSTVEILKQPPESGTDFIWRLSMADVTTDGEFSNFAGFERTLVLLEGEGITLNHQDGGQDVLKSPLQSARFSGDNQTFAKLHNGPIKDFNIMVQRDRCAVEVMTGKPYEKPSSKVKSDLLMLYAVEDDVIIRMAKGNPITLSHQHLLVSSSPVDTLIECSGGAYISILVSCL